MSESDAFRGENFFSVDIHVAAQKIAEREHPMEFRLQESGRTAVVEPRNDWSNPLLDAVFGTRDTSDSPIQEYFDLERRESTIPPRQADIRDDLRHEDEECFTIHIFHVDVLGRRARELFSCNEDDSGATNYFCKTTICIADDDGRFSCIVIKFCLNGSITEPFRVAFVEQRFTVDESVGAVNVCVNLTHPVVDILEETVNVFVIDYSSSIYIPPGAPLASEYP